MAKKGDKSLEMVIGLMILLVVAGVVIKMFITYVNPSRLQSSDPTNNLEFQNFIQSCENLCQKAKAGGTLDYCYTYFPKNDINNNGIPNEVIEVGEARWKACEDRVYCFLVSKCQLPDNTYLTARECVKRLYNSYISYGLPSDKAKTKIKNALIPGSCELPAGDNWYEDMEIDATINSLS
ncbi:MAG: hypothetical protein GXN99_02590 [Candidatus Nanohaloarchaeota archaeon]|nr:hypothetical protein [Candidatus Nanohaloarchaeota archaeon]